jgi:hypothetical protein
MTPNALIVKMRLSVVSTGMVIVVLKKTDTESQFMVLVFHHKKIHIVFVVLEQQCHFTNNVVKGILNAGQSVVMFPLQTGHHMVLYQESRMMFHVLKCMMLWIHMVLERLTADYAAKNVEVLGILHCTSRTNVKNARSNVMSVSN